MLRYALLFLLELLLSALLPGLCIFWFIVHRLSLAGSHVVIVLSLADYNKLEQL